MFTESVRAAGPYFQFKYGPPARTSSSDGSGSHQVQSVIFVVVITGYRAAFCVVGTRPCRGRSGLAAATLALLVGLRSRRLGELLVVFLASFFPEGQAFWMAFLQWLMPGLSSPLPLLVRKRCSSPPFLDAQHRHEPGRRALERAELITCCAVECVRGGVHGGVAFVTRPLG